MAVQSKGRCRRCDRLLSKSGMTRHLPTCVPRSLTPTLLLTVDNGDYWLQLAAAPDLRLEELEAFLRVFWLEARGCLGLYQHRGRRFVDEAWWSWWDGGRSTRISITELLEPGESCTYVYGLATPTVLRVTLRCHSPELSGGVRLEVLARNELPRGMCEYCGEAQGVHHRGLGPYLLCDVCADACGDADSSLAGPLPLRNSPRWPDQQGDVPDGGFECWPLPGLDPRSGGTVLVPPGRSLAAVLADPLVDHLVEHPSIRRRRRTDLLRGMRPTVVGQLMVLRLEAGRLPEASLGDMEDLLGDPGVRQQAPRLRRAMMDRDQVFAVRVGVASILERQEPRAGDSLRDDLLAQARSDSFVEVVAGVARHPGRTSTTDKMVADLLDAAPPAQQRAMLGAIGEICNERGKGAGTLLNAAVRRSSLAALRPLMVEVLLAVPDHGAAYALEALRDAAEDPEEAKAYQRAYLLAQTEAHRRRSR